jgi:hypothetical protein
MQANYRTPGTPTSRLIGRVATFAFATLFGLGIILGPARVSADEYIDSVESFQWVIEGQRLTLGPPDGAYLEIGYIPDDDPYPLPSSITLVFADNVAYDGPGADLRVYTVDEAPFGIVHIQASYDGVNYVSAGVFADDRGDIEIDLASLGLSAATRLRFTNASGPFGWYGFNLDAVEAIHSFEVPAISLSLDPPTDASPGFDEHTVLTTVNDGEPVAGIRVSSAIVSGPNAGLTDIATTYANGVFSFAWTGDGTEGIDTLESWLDLDADGVRDEGEPFGTATKLWRNGVTGAIAISDLGGGTIEVVVEDLDKDVTDGLDTVETTIATTTDPDGVTLVLTETEAHSGIFAGTIAVSQTGGELGALSMLQLEAVEGDTVTASYDDELDAQNDDPPPVTATLILGPAAEAHVTVCHVPPGAPDNPRSLTIGASAVAAHLAHGDTEGECAPSDFAPSARDAAHGPPIDKPGGGPPEGKGKQAK